MSTLDPRMAQAVLPTYAEFYGCRLASKFTGPVDASLLDDLRAHPEENLSELVDVCRAAGAELVETGDRLEIASREAEST